MKIIINILLLIFFGIGGIVAQNTCGTIQDDAFMQDLIKNKAMWHETIAKGYARRFVPVTFHLVAQNDGTGRLGREAVYKTVCQLNERYEELGVDISFYIKDFNEVNNTGIWNNPTDNSGFIRSLKDGSSMNIFVVEEINRNGGTGTTLGYYQGGNNNDFIVMRKASMGDASYTIEHEIGHFFTLGHTHRGWEDEGWAPAVYDQKITFLEIGSSQTNPVLVELVDKSNCEFAADMICDTPADYGRGFTCNCCVLNDIILDRNCDTLAPMMNNIMSYSGNCDSWVFSPDQIVAMQTSYDANNRAYLRQGDVDTYEPIVDTIVYVHPGFAEKVDIYDNVKLEWEPVPNAEFYQGIINGNPFVTTDNFYNVTDLPPNKDFNIWGVKAYNKFGGECVKYDEIYFDVGDQETSAVSDLAFVESVDIYPNPISNNSSLSISLNSVKNFEGEIIIYDLAGKMVLSDKANFSNGKNIHSVSLLDLVPGIHIIEIRTSEGSITDKLIVE